MALKQETIALHRTDDNGNKVLQMPITRAENIEGVLSIANGGTGGNTFVKSASISGKTITLNMSDGTTKTLTTQDTINNGTVTRIANITGTSNTSVTTKTITGLTANKPAFIFIKNTGTGDIQPPYVSSGTSLESIYDFNGNNTIYAGRTSSAVVIPTGTSLVISFTKLSSGSQTYTIECYQ